MKRRRGISVLRIIGKIFNCNNKWCVRDGLLIVFEISRNTIDDISVCGRRCEKLRKNLRNDRVNPRITSVYMNQISRDYKHRHNPIS
jgi:hypothetical protein